MYFSVIEFEIKRNNDVETVGNYSGAVMMTPT